MLGARLKRLMENHLRLTATNKMLKGMNTTLLDQACVSNSLDYFEYSFLTCCLYNSKLRWAATISRSSCQRLNTKGSFKRKESMCVVSMSAKLRWETLLKRRTWETWFVTRSKSLQSLRTTNRRSRWVSVLSMTFAIQAMKALTACLQCLRDTRGSRGTHRRKSTSWTSW